MGRWVWDDKIKAGRGSLNEPGWPGLGPYLSLWIWLGWCGRVLLSKGGVGYCPPLSSIR